MLADDPAVDGLSPDRATDIDWHHMLWLGRQHGVLLFLQQALAAPELGGLCPPEVSAQLRALREVNQLHALEHGREICLLHDLFSQAGIAALPVDGWMAAQCLHDDRALFEARARFHFLVPAADHARAREVLVAAGHPLEFDPGKLIKRGCSPVLLDRESGTHPAAPRFWERSTILAFGGRRLPRLATEHWLLLRTPHYSGREEVHLGRAMEIVSLARQIAPEAWPDVLAEAARFDRAERVAAGVIACHQALDIPAPHGLPRTDPSPRVAAPAPADLAAVAAPFLPTPPVVVRRMLELAETNPADLVCDLGCGDGRIAIRAARDFGARGFGIDRDPARIAEANAHAVAEGVQDRVTFACGDLFAADLADATVVTCYLLPQLQPPLLAKLRREARPGTRIVSHEFTFPDWPPEKTAIVRTGPARVSQLYLWRLP